jgi:A118 family predicted phage portal protein
MSVDVAISNSMKEAIELWTKIYENNSPWVDNDKIFSMNLGAGIATEFAKLVTIEFESEISNNDFLNKEYQKVIDKVRNATEFAAAKGGVVFKPYISNGHILVDIVQADNFYPTAYDSNGEITGAIFPDKKTVGNFTYTRIEYHNFVNGEHTVINKAFKKNNFGNVSVSMDSSLGDEVPLQSIPEWSEIVPQIVFHDIERPLFSYFKMPMANRIDTSSPLGTSVFERIADQQGGLLRKVDEQYSKILWEYDSKETVVHADRDLFTKDKQGNPVLPMGKERLYRTLDIDTAATSQKLIDVFSPEIRDTSLFNGLNKLLQQVEFAVGLAKGTLSDVTETDKTATEVKSSKQRSFQTVKDIQKSLKISLEHLAYCMWYVGSMAKLPVNKGTFEDNADMSFDFDDSIVVDHESEIASMQTDVSLGIIKKVYYIMKKYKKTREEAEEMMQDDTIITGDPFAKNQE